jgi:tetratricopeptide (TPR) repeat protein
MRVFFALLLSGVLGLPANSQALAAVRSGKVALVIGNAKYPDNEFVLTDVANDTQDIADELKRDGFDVDKQINLTGYAMRQALDRFYGRIEQDNVALIFFDGFGVQSGRQTYLLPVDAQIWAEADVTHDGFNLETILDEMNNRGASVKIALLDASRRNPFERRFRRYSAGLAPAVTPSNTLVMYSSALGSVASNTKNDHSLFVTELLREIRTPGVSAEQALKNTQLGVISATKGEEQVSWLSSSLTSAFSFTGPVEVPKPKPACEVATPESAPSEDDLANDPRIKELSRRIAGNRNDLVSYYKRGQIYASKRAYALAAQDFNEAIRINPKDFEARNNRCWTLAAVGNLQPALADCNEALRLNPGFADALDSRGLVNLKLGKLADAIEDYSESLQKNARSISSLFGRGIATKRTGGDGSADLDLAQSMDKDIASEFAGYGVTECIGKPTP